MRARKFFQSVTHQSIWFSSFARDTPHCWIYLFTFKPTMISKSRKNFVGSISRSKILLIFINRCQWPSWRFYIAICIRCRTVRRREKQCKTIWLSKIGCTNGMFHCEECFQLSTMGMQWIIVTLPIFPA